MSNDYLKTNGETGDPLSDAGLKGGPGFILHMPRSEKLDDANARSITRKSRQSDWLITGFKLVIGFAVGFVVCLIFSFK